MTDPTPPVPTPWTELGWILLVLGILIGYIVWGFHIGFFLPTMTLCAILAVGGASILVLKGKVDG